MLAGGGRFDGHMAGQLPHINPSECSEKEGSGGAPDVANQPGGGHSLIVSRGLGFGWGRGGHFKWSCPYREQDEAAARNGGQRAATPQGGASEMERPRGLGEDDTMDRISSRTRV